MRRNRQEIELEILRYIASGEDKITHLFFKCNTNYLLVNKLLQDLEKRGYITILIKQTKTAKTKRYVTTAKGREMLNKYNTFEESFQQNGLV